MPVLVPRSLAPSNLLTVPEFRIFAKAVGRSSWMGGARYYAEKTGGALVLKADGSLLILVLSGGKIRQKTHKPGAWRWA